MSEKEARDIVHILLEMATEERETALTGWTTRFFFNLVANPNFNQLWNSWLTNDRQDKEVFLTEGNDFLSYWLDIKSATQIWIACFISKTF
jgi:hypothetical protein